MDQLIKKVLTPGLQEPNPVFPPGAMVQYELVQVHTVMSESLTTANTKPWLYFINCLFISLLAGNYYFMGDSLIPSLSILLLKLFHHGHWDSNFIVAKSEVTILTRWSIPTSPIIMHIDIMNAVIWCTEKDEARLVWCFSWGCVASVQS